MVSFCSMSVCAFLWKRMVIKTLPRKFQSVKWLSFKDSMMASETCLQILATKLLCYLSNNVAKTCSRGSKFSRELKSSTLSSFIKYSLRIFSCIYVLHAFPNFLYTVVFLVNGNGVFCVKKLACIFEIFLRNFIGIRLIKFNFSEKKISLYKKQL